MSRSPAAVRMRVLAVKQTTVAGIEVSFQMEVRLR